MSERLNKTSICSVVFLDIVGYSKKPDSEQIDCKDRFNHLISEAIKDIAPNDRIILDTGDGAAIALMGAPEEALFFALTFRDGILGSGRNWRVQGLAAAPSLDKVRSEYAEQQTPLLVRIGINLGPVRVVKDINGRPNIIGDGINVAQRVMSFAEPNQILVSRSYYEVTSRLTEELTQMFTYSGIRHDKHVREHEVYMILPRAEESGTFGQQTEPKKAQVELRTLNKLALGLVLLLLLAFAGAFVYWAKSRPVVKNSQPAMNAVVANPPEPEKAPEPAPASPATGNTANKTSTHQPVVTPDASAPKKKSKPAAENKPEAKEKPAGQEASTSDKNDAGSEKSGWKKFTESIKQGTSQASCTDAQRSLKQCK
jgi:class 3 adenylate cyclase